MSGHTRIGLMTSDDAPELGWSFVKFQAVYGCMNDSAGKLCPDIMLPRAIANVQKETEDAWAGARVQAVSVAASAGCDPG